MSRDLDDVLRAQLGQCLAGTSLTTFAHRPSIERYVGKVRDCYIDRAAGERILRIKGLANITGVDGPRVVQCVGNVRFTPRDLPAWPPGGPHTSLIFIVDGLERDYLVKVFEMFCDRTAGD